MAESIKVLIVDDHTMFADGVKGLLSSEAQLEVIALAHTGADALQALEEHPVDVVLLDINLPDMDGIEVCAQARDRGHSCAIIGLSMHEEEAFITSMLDKGANGYLLKSADRSELVAAIEAVHGGEFYYSKQVTQTLIEALMNKQGQSAPTRKKVSTVALSERETEVLHLIADELTTSEIGEKLFISQNTVETHRRKLLEKLGARNTAGLIRIAFEQGLL